MKDKLSQYKEIVMKKLQHIKEKLIAGYLVVTEKKKAVVTATVQGDGYVDTAFKILIAVVIGALVLWGIYAIINNTVMPNLTSKITTIFSKTPTGTP